MQQEFVRSRVWDKLLRRQQILAKQLERTTAIVEQISCSPALHEEGCVKYQQVVETHTVQGFKAEDQVRLSPDPSLHSVLPEMVAQDVFNDLPRWDGDVTRADQALFKAMMLDRADTYEPFDEVPIQERAGAHLEHATCRSLMASEGASIKVFDELPLADVVWDEAPFHDLDLQNDLLQQIVQVEECPSGEEKKLVDEAANDKFCTEIVALGSELLDSEKAKLIIQSDNGEDIMWDEDVPHNLGLHNIFLEQLTDVMQGQEGNDLVTCVTDLPSVQQFDMVTSKDTFDEISKVQEMNCASKKLVDSGEKQGASDLQLLFVEIQPWNAEFAQLHTFDEAMFVEHDVPVRHPEVASIQSLLYVDVVCSGFDEKPQVDVLWDKEIQSDIGMHDGLLQQLVSGQEYCDGEKIVVNAEHTESSFHSVVVDQEQKFLELEPAFEEIHKQCMDDVNQVLSERYIKSMAEELLGVLVHNLILPTYKEDYDIGEYACFTGEEAGICKIHVEQQLELSVLSERPWDPGISTATAWGQAVFRGGGNVMTQMMAQEKPSTVESICQGTAQGKAQVQKLHSRSSAHRQGIDHSKQNREKRDGKSFFLLRLEILPNLNPLVITHAPGLISPVSHGCYNETRREE